MIARRILFVVNRAQLDGPQREAIDTVLPGVEITVSERLVNPNEFDLVILWFYRRIVADASDYSNIVVIHASALPKGRGMAPIYYTLADDLSTCTITAIRAVNELDAGDVLCRAHVAVEPAMTATALRAVIVKVTLRIAAGLLERDLSHGERQEGEPTYNRLRTPAQNEVALSARLDEIMPHLRACEPDHPAFTMYRGVKYLLSAVPAEPASDPVVSYHWIAPLRSNGRNDPVRATPSKLERFGSHS